MYTIVLPLVKSYGGGGRGGGNIHSNKNGNKKTGYTNRQKKEEGKERKTRRRRPIICICERDWQAGRQAAMVVVEKAFSIHLLLLMLQLMWIKI